MVFTCSSQLQLAMMEELVHKHENNIGDSSSRIKALNSHINELRKAIEMAEGRLRTSETNAVQLR